MKIQTRIILTVLLTTFLGNILKEWYDINSHRERAEAQLEAKIVTNGKLITGSMVYPIYNLDYDRQNEILNLYFADPDIKSIHFTESTGDINKVLDKSYVPSDNTIERQYNLSYKGLYLGEILVVYTRVNISKQLDEELKSAVFTFLISLIIVIFILYFLLNQIVKPIEELTEVATSITRGDISREIKIVRNDQVGLLAKSFMHMRQSVYEQISRVRRENRERQLVEEELQKVNSNLESLVRERTIELEEVIVDLKNTQNQLIESEKMASLGILVAGVAHEINTPVGVTVTAASHLKDEVLMMEELYNNNQISRSKLEGFIETTHEIADIIMSNMDKSGNLIKSFKNIAVDQSSEVKREFHLKDYLDEIALSLKSKFKRTNHKISIECSKDIYINSFPGAISQIFTNLIMNSLIHGFENMEQGEISITVTLVNHMLSITYKDNGKGIPPEIVDKVFHPFFTTRRGQGGSGLGLSIVYNLITSTLNGQVNCISELGRGVEFKFNIPVN